MELLYERGSHALKEFREIDALFKELKAADFSKMRPIVTKLERAISDVVSTSIVIEIHNAGEFGDTFAVLPILKPTKTKSNIVDSTSIKLHEVELLYFIIGGELINNAKPRQLTAILLHEIGHITQHISRMSLILNTVLRKVKYVSDLLSRIPIINLVFTPLFIITSRSLNFRNHAYEYDADKFAVRYGYGDDLAEWALSELKGEHKKVKFSFFKFIHRITDMFEGSSHPSFEKRLNSIIKEMKSNYSNQYGNKKIEKLLNQHYKI